MVSPVSRRDMWPVSSVDLVAYWARYAATMPQRMNLHIYLPLEHSERPASSRGHDHQRNGHEGPTETARNRTAPTGAVALGDRRTRWTTAGSRVRSPWTVQ